MKKNLTLTSSVLITLLPVSNFFANLRTQRGCMWPIFLKIPWVNKTWNMLIIRMQSPIDINLSVQFRNISNLIVSEKIFRCIYINGCKVYFGEYYFIFHSNIVAVINCTYPTRRRWVFYSPILSNTVISMAKIFIETQATFSLTQEDILLTDYA